MGIDSDTLERWGSYDSGPIASAKETQEKIQNLLQDTDSSLYEKYDDYETFLQGSYANYTIIRGDSDVDIVTCLNDVYYSDTHELEEPEKERYESATSDGRFSWEEFRSDVLDELEDAYGTSAITEGDKAIKIETSSLPLSADIVPATQHRHYTSFGYGSGNYIEGIAFWPQNGFHKITNYPKQHIENGSTKQGNTNDRYKETIRIFKSARNAADDQGYIDKEIAPSYFIECLLYNVDNDAFVYDRQSRFLKVLEDLIDSDMENFVCQNGAFYLFGDVSTQWNKQDAVEYLRGLVNLWEEW